MLLLADFLCQPNGCFFVTVFKRCPPLVRVKQIVTRYSLRNGYVETVWPWEDGREAVTVCVKVKMVK